ncbi:MAG: type II toxin-antitoxin system RelE/ParE family toxin [Chloroflexia bacterium]|nr:type II toxin-antitoxin system RelE/ParE family toxin [Chloroflexia bacterium]
MRDIHVHSREQWGETHAEQHLADLYAVLARIAERPELGELRQHRSYPFLMAPARRHFVVYDRLPDGIVVLTVLHQGRDIEGIIAAEGPSFRRQIMALRKKH